MPGRPRFEQFFALRRFQPSLAFAPDGSIYFTSDVSGQFNLWRTSDERWPRQLTAFEERSVRSVTVSPDGATVVFTADRHGDEFHQLYALPAGGGWPESWTEEPDVQHFLGPEGWSPDGASLAYSANSGARTDMDVWLRDLASGGARKVFGRGQYAAAASWSPDGSRLLVMDFRSTTDTSLFLIDPASGEALELRPHNEETKFLPGPWAQDGSGFYFRTDEGREFVGLAFYDVAGGRYEWVATPDADVEDVAGGTGSRVLAWLVNEEGWFKLRLRDLETGRDLPEPELPPGIAYQTTLTVSRDGRYAALLWATPTRTFELYRVETATGRAERLTDSMLGGLDETELVEPELIGYPTFDGREIPAWLFRPHGANGRVPAVLAIHGGPESQAQPWYQPIFQYLLSAGIAVLAPNIRGSTGYGRTYQKLIHRDWGGGDLEDMRHAAEWLRAQRWVDAGRIGVYGGSYGGFASLSCVTRLPEYWAAAVDIFGPSNLVTFAKAVPPTWRRFIAKWVGDPETEADMLMERSPITYVENVKAPLLVIQGANDPRVVRGESDQMVDKLRSLGRTVEYHVFEDEGHGFTKRRNQVEAFRLTADWLERHLVGSGG